jgi:hypothetical protein
MDCPGVGRANLLKQATTLKGITPPMFIDI